MFKEKILFVIISKFKSNQLCKKNKENVKIRLLEMANESILLYLLIETMRHF